MLEIGTLENWLWEAACKIRGEVDAPKYKDYILLLIFIKRLSDVFDDEVGKLIKEYGNEKTAFDFVEAERIANEMNEVLAQFPHWKTNEEHEGKIKTELYGKIKKKENIDPKDCVKIGGYALKVLKGR